MRRYSFEDFVAIIKERIDKITLNKEKFTIDQNYDEKDQSGKVKVYYDGKVFVVFHYLVTNRIVNGHKQIRNQFFLYASFYPEWYVNFIKGIQKDVIISEFLDANINGNNWQPLKNYLDMYLPIEKPEEIANLIRIANDNNVDVKSVSFDTYRKAYVLKVDINDILGINDKNETNNREENIELYKYVSLETFRCMLNYNTFRMNSMIAMNDVYEGIWLHNLIYKKDDIEGSDYYKSVIRQRNTLITSFTDKEDDADIWRFYGDNGKGVCLCFIVNKSDVIKVVYTDKNNQKINNLSKSIGQMTKSGLNIVIEDINNNHFVVKSSSFSSEGEYRYIYNAKDDETQLANYNGLLSPYKDFKYDATTGLYDNLPFKLKGVLIGRNIPYYSTNMPLLIERTREKFPGIFICESAIKELRG